MKKYKVYLFDLDNTLFDSLESSRYVFEEAFKRIGVSFKSEDTLLYTRVPLQTVYKKFVKDCSDEEIEPFIELITGIVNSEKTNSTIKIFDDTYDTVLDLKMSEAILGIVTSNSEKHVKSLLKKFDLDFGIFDIIIGSETTTEAKPSPRSINEAINKIEDDVTLGEIVYIGDSLNDMLASKNAGIDGILLDRKNEYKDEPYTRINSLKELL